MDAAIQNHLANWLRGQGFEDPDGSLFRDMQSRYDEDPEFFKDQTWWLLFDTLQGEK